jgi:hypothetical protein
MAQGTKMKSDGPWYRRKEKTNSLSDIAQLYTVLCSSMELENPNLSVFVTVNKTRK